MIHEVSYAIIQVVTVVMMVATLWMLWKELSVMFTPAVPGFLWHTTRSRDLPSITKKGLLIEYCESRTPLRWEEGLPLSSRVIWLAESPYWLMPSTILVDVRGLKLWRSSFHTEIAVYLANDDIPPDRLYLKTRIGYKRLSDGKWFFRLKAITKTGAPTVREQNKLSVDTAI